MTDEVYGPKFLQSLTKYANVFIQFILSQCIVGPLRPPRPLGHCPHFGCAPTDSPPQLRRICPDPSDRMRCLQAVHGTQIRLIPVKSRQPPSPHTVWE